MAEDKSSFDIIGKAWNTAKIYGGSNAVKKYDAVVESDSLRTLADFVRDPRNFIETRGIDFDSKADDRLQKYNIVRITPTKKLDEAESFMQMYLITDEHGHDIAIYCPDAKRPEDRFRLAEKIKDGNERIIGNFEGEGRKTLESEFSIENMEKLVEKLSKGEGIDLHSVEQARDEIVRYSEQGDSYQIEEQEDPEEKKALEGIPIDMRAEVIQIARDNDIKIKEMLIIRNPRQIARKLDNNRKNQISEYSGPVILIRAKSRKSR